MLCHRHSGPLCSMSARSRTQVRQARKHAHCCEPSLAAVSQTGDTTRLWLWPAVLCVVAASARLARCRKTSTRLLVSLGMLSMICAPSRGQPLCALLSPPAWPAFRQRRGEQRSAPLSHVWTGMARGRQACQAPAARSGPGRRRARAGPCKARSGALPSSWQNGTRSLPASQERALI